MLDSMDTALPVRFRGESALRLLGVFTFYSRNQHSCTLLDKNCPEAYSRFLVPNTIGSVNWDYISPLANFDALDFFHLNQKESRLELEGHSVALLKDQTIVRF